LCRITDKATHWRQVLRFACVALALGFLPPDLTARDRVSESLQQTLHVSLDPERRRLDGKFVIDLPRAPGSDLSFNISKKATISEVTALGRPLAYEFADGVLRIPGSVLAANPGDPISIAYHVIFDDPVPAAPINTDNPGYGVTGTIGENGAFLLGGAGWYPVWQEAPAHTWRITVDGPEGWIAVTAGRSLGHDTADGRTRSIWEITTPTRGLHLSAARYQVTEKAAGPITVATFWQKRISIPPSNLSMSTRNDSVRTLSRNLRWWKISSPPDTDSRRIR